jgi:urease accessory protein UreF
MQTKADNKIARTLSATHPGSFQSSASKMPLRNVSTVDDLTGFLSHYQQNVIIQFELPIILRAHRHTLRNEGRELIALDRDLLQIPELMPYQLPSKRVGQARLERLWPLRHENRAVSRYITAVKSSQAHGWHTVVYGITLALYKLSITDGLRSYEKETLTGFAHAVKPVLKMSDSSTVKLLQSIYSDMELPPPVDFGSGDNR